MELRQLQYFIIVAQEQNFSKAAQKAYVSPQAISKAIQNLESELNVVLFLRHAHGIELTGEGQTLLKRAYSITNSVNAIPFDLHVAKSSEQSIIPVGLAEGPSDWIDIEKLLSFNKLHPRFRISLMLDTDRTIENWLLADKIELAIFGSGGTNTKIDFTSLERSQTFVTLNRFNSLASKKVIELTDLKEQDLIIGSDDYYGCSRFKTLCNALGFTPRVLHQCHNINLAMRLVCANEGIFLGCSNVMDFAGSEKITIVPLGNDPRLFDLQVANKKNVRLSEGAALLKEHIIQMFSEDRPAASEESSVSF